MSQFPFTLSVIYPRIFWVLLSVCALSHSFAQGKRIPVIRAGKELVDIREDRKLNRGNWTIMPDVRPDIFLTSARQVVFLTDTDSILVNVDAQPGWHFDFIILLNGKDSAYTQVRYREPFLAVLRKASRYDSSDRLFIPRFTYETMENPALAALRREFKLDSVAGSGNENSRIINVMHWIHYLIPHDGMNGNPEVKNAMSMIAACRKENRGLNCRGLATVLNECYLALGIPSRFITCLPKDTADPDCHVINMVFSRELDKWIWIDPSFDAYVMDEKGTLLGIAEVRERLIKGKPLILNPDANWNRQQSQTKEGYLEDYMAKNLYYLECPLRSTYDTETYREGKLVEYVRLVPSINKQSASKKSSGKNFIVERTITNDVLFWSKPAH